MASASGDPWFRDSRRLALGLQQQELQALQDAVLARRLQHTLLLLPGGAATGAGSEALLLEAVRRDAGAADEDYQFLEEQLGEIRVQLLELALPAAGDDSDGEPAAMASPAEAAATSVAIAAAAGRRASGPAAAVGAAAGLTSGGAGPAAGGSAGRSISGATITPAAAAGVRGGLAIRCLGCRDQFPVDEVTCAGADDASTTSSSSSSSSSSSGGGGGGGAAGCGHYFCRGCFSAYVHSAVRDGVYPVLCPMRGGGCAQQLSRDAVRSALLQVGHAEDLQRLDRLEVVAALGPPTTTVHCPHASCSALLVRPDEDEEEEGAVPLPGYDGAVECPECHRAFCLRCGIRGWHTGYTCAQFQALPEHLRSAEDVAMLAMVSQRGWKRCPGCGFPVERTAGCNHMRCRCGCSFCYSCGRRANGGTFGCRC